MPLSDHEKSIVWRTICWTLVGAGGAASGVAILVDTTTENRDLYGVALLGAILAAIAAATMIVNRHITRCIREQLKAYHQGMEDGRRVAECIPLRPNH